MTTVSVPNPEGDLRLKPKNIYYPWVLFCHLNCVWTDCTVPKQVLLTQNWKTDQTLSHLMQNPTRSSFETL